MNRMSGTFKVICALFLIGSALVLWKGPWRPMDRTHADSKAQGIYYCPMHPSFTSDRPGDCSICGMRLVKKESGPSAEVCVLHECSMMHSGQNCPMLVVAKPGEKVECPMCKEEILAPKDGAPAKKILYWTDPMLPGYKSDKPGKSPMGMDLVPVYGEGQERTEGSSAAPKGYAAVLLSTQKQQLIGVRTVPAQKRFLAKTIRTWGRIAYDPELYQAEAEYLQAQRAFKEASGQPGSRMVEQASRLADAAALRLKLLGVGDEMIQEIRKSDQPDQSLLLADPQGRVWVYAFVYEFELPLIKTGQKLLVEIPSLSGKVFEGAIQSIDPVLDPATRSARVRAVLVDTDHFLKPEMYVNVSVQVPVGEVLSVPHEAVFDTGLQKIAFVEMAQGLFEPRQVIVGALADGYYELKEGIAEGEKVVTNGNFLIDSESRLQSVLRAGASTEHRHGS